MEYKKLFLEIGISMLYSSINFLLPISLFTYAIITQNKIVPCIFIGVNFLISYYLFYDGNRLKELLLKNVKR